MHFLLFDTHILVLFENRVHFLDEVQGEVFHHVLGHLRLGRQFRVRSRIGVDGQQRPAAVIEFLDAVGRHGDILRLGIAQRRLEVFHILEAFRLLLDILGHAVHVFGEFLLLAPARRSLHFHGSERFRLLVLDLHLACGKRTALLHIVERLLQRLVRIQRRHEFRVRAHEVADKVLGGGTVSCVEVVRVTMPLHQVIRLLVLDIVVHVETVLAVLFHQVLNKRREHFFLNLVHGERHAGSRAVLGKPDGLEQVILHARRSLQVERLVGSRIFLEIEGHVPDALDFFGFQDGRILVVGGLQYVCEDAVAVIDQLVAAARLAGRNHLDGFAQGLHQGLVVIDMACAAGGIALFHVLLHDIDIIEHLERRIELLLVEHVDDRMSGRSLACREILEEVVFLGIGLHERKRHRLPFAVTEQVADISHLPVDGAHVVVHRHVLHRGRIVGRIDLFRFVGTFHDRNLLDFLGHGIESLVPFFRLANRGKAELRLFRPFGKVHGDMSVSKRHVHLDRDIGHANLRDLVVAADIGLCLFIGENLLFRSLDLLPETRQLDREHDDEDDTQDHEEDAPAHGGRRGKDNTADSHQDKDDEAHDARSLAVLDMVYLVPGLVDFRFKSHFFRDDFFGSGLIVVEQDFGLVLVDVFGFREYFSGHVLILV